QLLLLRHVPGAVAGADPVGDLQTALDPLLAEHVVDVLGQALDGARAHAVEHGRQRQLARLPQLGAAALERFADRADGGPGRRHVLRLRTTSAIRRMCSGLEPQQAPTMLHPASSSAGYSRAIAAGPSSYVTVSPVVIGSPAFGYATSGASVTCRISRMITMARSGPRPQFMPTTSAPAARRFLATSAGLSPHIVRSRS